MKKKGNIRIEKRKNTRSTKVLVTKKKTKALHRASRKQEAESKRAKDECIASLPSSPSLHVREQGRCVQSPQQRPHRRRGPKPTDGGHPSFAQVSVQIRLRSDVGVIG
jgi:hypothetical protein